MIKRGNSYKTRINANVTTMWYPKENATQSGSACMETWIDAQ